MVDVQNQWLETYLDHAATTIVDQRVAELVMSVMTEEFGNAGSRTHTYGLHALRLVNVARDRVANAIGAKSDEIVFTSGATESNNIAILGLAAHGIATGEIGRAHV